MNVPASVQARLQRYDKALKLRWAGDRWAVERKGRDGRYVRIGSVAPELLGDGEGIIRKLHSSDLWKLGDREVGKNAERVGADIDYEERWAERKRKESRRSELVDMAKEDHDQIRRRLGSRINNAGLSVGA